MAVFPDLVDIDDNVMVSVASLEMLFGSEIRIMESFCLKGHEN